MISRTHDFDKNTKLDGLEILQAIRHAVHEQKENSLVADVTISPEDLEYYIGKVIFIRLKKKKKTI